jgi:hypothetical protein
LGNQAAVYSTAKVAVGSTVCLESLSFTLISILYKPGLQVGGGKRLLQRDLIAHIAHRVGRLDGMDDGLVVGVGHIVFERGRRFVRLLVHAEIVNLHPEIQLLIALEQIGLPSEGATRGRTFMVPITKLPVPTFLVATGSI